MKKLLTLLIAVITMTGCVSRPVLPTYTNEVQAEFNRLLEKGEHLEYEQNGIKKQERQKELESELTHFLDSVVLFVGFEGQIYNPPISSLDAIDISEQSDVTYINFKIECKLDEYREVTFVCSRAFKTNEIQDAYFYKQLKDISVYSPVYFDGVIRRDDSGVKHESSSDYFSSPRFTFLPLAISNTPRRQLSKPLLELLKIDDEGFEIFRKEFNKELPKNSFKRYIDPREAKIKSLLDSLTPEEKEYRNDFASYQIYR